MVKLDLQDQEWLLVWGKVHIRTPSGYELPTKRSKKNVDKSAVVLLKKSDCHENVWEPSVNYGHDRSGQRGKKRDHVLKRRSSQRRSSNAQELGCVFQDMTPPKSSSILRKSSDIRKPIRCVKFTKPLYVTLKFETKILRSDTFAQVNLISAAPKIEHRSQEETEWQERGAREAAGKLAKNVFK